MNSPFANVTLLQQGSQPVAVPPTGGKGGPVLHRHNVLSMEVRLKLAELVQIDDRRAVHSDEFSRVQPCLHRLDRLANEVLSAAGVEGRIVPRRIDPLDVVRADEIDPGVRFYGKP